jgi:potassium-dependent mechanosensitive channel
VPNGQLISDRLTNWTLSNRQHGVELPVAVAQGTDPNRVREILERTATAHPLVAKDPPPQALVTNLGPNSITVEVRAWTDSSNQWMQVRSELAIAVNAALTAEKIAMK